MKDIPDDYSFEPNEEKCAYCKHSDLRTGWCIAHPFENMQFQQIIHATKTVIVRCGLFQYRDKDND